MAIAADLLSIDRGVPLTGPSTLHIDVTNGCNTNCVTCWDHSPLLTLRPGGAPARSAAWKRQRIEKAQLIALLDDAVSLGGLRAIILSGMGEPFTHPDIYEFIAEVKNRGLHLTIITNLVAADADRILDLGVDQLLIGIHAATEGAYLAFHPSFRAAEWDKLHAMLAAFQAVGKRWKHVQVVASVNAPELVQMVELGARYQALQVNFKLASLGEGTEAVRIDDVQRARLIGELVPAAVLRARALGIETNLDVFAAQLEAGGAATAPIEDIGCFMGYVYARVLVDGTVLYCCSTETRVGTLADGARLSDLWRGEAWNRMRERLRRGDYLPACHQCGKVNQNVKLGRRFARAFGDERLLSVTGRA